MRTESEWAAAAAKLAGKRPTIVDICYAVKENLPSSRAEMVRLAAQCKRHGIVTILEGTPVWAELTGDTLYRGYWIRVAHDGAVWVEKDCARVAWARDVAHGKEIVDSRNRPA